MGNVGELGVISDPRVYDFGERMEFSRGQRERSDTALLARIIDGATNVHKTNEHEDRAGVDYVVTLRRGAQVFVDAKTRTRGCSRWWNNGPELALEIWSVMPGGRYKTPSEYQKTGWTLNEQSPVDLILFTFHQSDSEKVYLLPFQLLRMAFRRNVSAWSSAYKVDIQSSSWDRNSWQSMAVFVPASIVVSAIGEVMHGHVSASDIPF